MTDTSKPLTLREALEKIIAIVNDPEYSFQLRGIEAIASEALAKGDEGKDMEKILTEYGDKLRQRARDWHKGQHVGMPQSSKEIGAQVDGFEEGYSAALKEDTGKQTYYGGQISEDEIIGDKLIKEDTGKEDEG